MDKHPTCIWIFKNVLTPGFFTSFTVIGFVSSVCMDNALSCSFFSLSNVLCLLLTALLNVATPHIMASFPALPKNIIWAQKKREHVKNNCIKLQIIAILESHANMQQIDSHTSGPCHMTSVPWRLSTKHPCLHCVCVYLLYENTTGHTHVLHEMR